MEQITLRAVWSYDPNATLGSPGGFGTVFRGSSESGRPVAVKRLNPDVGQHVHREQKIVEQLIGKNFNHVVPILDAGQDTDSDSYFVVMSLAERSLQDDLDKGKTWRDKDAAVILLQICQGLSEVPEIVHRDLKPANILYHEDKWKVADFGIAKVIEDTTSLHTLKGCLTPDYAAPEQWQFKSPTAATDIYALACIGYAILRGSPPYKASQKAGFREQHLNSPSPPLADHDPQLCTWLTTMLGKEPGTRPSRERVCAFFGQYCQDSQDTSSGEGLIALARAGQLVTQQAAEGETRLRLQKYEQELRNKIAREGAERLRAIIEIMSQKMLEKTPAAKIVRHDNSVFGVHLGQAELNVAFMYSLQHRALPENAFYRSGWDVVTAATIELMQSRPNYVWGASLWYAKLSDDSYRWWEVSYFDPALPRLAAEPFSLIDDVNLADEVANNSLTYCQIAEGPKPIDGTDFDDFCDRWSLRLAKASQGQLEHPRYLPLD